MRQRASGIFITPEKKILLVKDCKAEHYYPPGGGIRDGESHFDALVREFEEELGLKVTSHEKYWVSEHMNIVLQVPQQEHFYLVTCEGTPSLQQGEDVEDFGFYSSQCIIEQGIVLPHAFETNTWPKLLADNYL